MNLYGGHHDYSLFLLDMGASDPAFMESLYSNRSSGTGLIYGSRYYSDDAEYPASISTENPRSVTPPVHRHDGTSPLPLGMDWSPSPRVWDGRNTVWPRDYHSGWSYCVTIPFWTVTPGSTSSDFVVFYRVQVGVQSPDGITTMRGVLRRFSDFLNLFSELQKAFPKKKLPPAPSKHRLRSKSKDLLEGRRSLLEDWIAMLLSDIDVSRSLGVATFLELEVAARLSFHEANQIALDGNLSASSMVPSDQILLASDNSLASGISLASDFDGDSSCAASELESPIVHVNNLGVGTGNTHVQESVNLKAVEVGFSRNVGVGSAENVGLGDPKKFSDIMENTNSRNKVNTDASQETPLNENDTGHISGAESSDQASLTRKLSRDILESEITSLTSNSDSPHAVSIVVGTEEQRKIEKILTNVQQNIATSKFDVKDLISRLDQELAVRQYLSTKVKDLELELETTRQNKEETVQQAILMERERVTQMQWDIVEFRTKCLELEAKLKCEQEEKVFIESTKASIIQENGSLRQELDLAKDQVEKLLKQLEVSESKSKNDVKLLSREIRSLRNSQLDLRQELNALLIKEKAEMETILEEERKRRECVTSINSKLLHECESLSSRFEECRVKIFTDEGSKLTVETSFPSDAVDMLTTSDNRIGLLLAEAQLLAKDVEKATASSNSYGSGEMDDDKLRKMVIDIFIDNAMLRKQINSALWYALKMPEKSDKDGAETSVIDTVLGKFLDR